MKRGIAQLRKIEDRILAGNLHPTLIRPALQGVIERGPEGLEDGVLEGPFEVSFHYGKDGDSLPEAIEAGGYSRSSLETYKLDQQWSDWTTPDYYPIPDPGPVEKELWLFDIGVHFGPNRYPRENEVLEALSLSGLVPETIRELLAFGQNDLSASDGNPIIALGAIQEHCGSYVLPLIGSYRRTLWTIIGTANSQGERRGELAPIYQVLVSKAD